MKGNTTHRVDAVVIGAGVGGLAAAARLTQAGYRTLLVEEHDRLGGRASTREVDGFLLNTGAIAIELDGPVPQLLAEFDEQVDFYVPPKRDTVLLLGKRTIDVAAPLASRIRAALPLVFRGLLAIPRFRPRPGQTTTEWLNRMTRSKTVHGLLDNILGGFFAASGREVPAEVFTSYMIKGSAFRFLGFPPGGTVEVWKPLGAALERRGTDIWLSSRVTALTSGPDGTIATARVERADGTVVTVEADVFVSNAGPLATARLATTALPASYLEDVERRTAGGAILTVHFASRKALTSWPALAFVGRSRRMTYAVNLSAPENGQAKAGWYQYSAASTPRPATGDFDLEQEKELLLADVRDNFHGFDEHARVLAWDITAHDWAAQRAVTGHDLPIETPVANLFNVGDGVKIGADAGTAACVRTADAAVARIRRSFPAARPTAATSTVA